MGIGASSSQQPAEVEEVSLDLNPIFLGTHHWDASPPPQKNDDRLLGCFCAPMFQGLQTSWWPPHPPAEAPPPHVLLNAPKPPWQVEKEKQEKEQNELENDEKAKHAMFLREKQIQMEKMKEKEKERKKILQEEQEQVKKQETEKPRKGVLQSWSWRQSRRKGELWQS